MEPQTTGPMAETPSGMAERILADCGGDAALALETLARIALEARRGMSAGMIRLGPSPRR